MKLPDTIQVFEYETLRVGQKGFTDEHFERLAIFLDDHRKPYYSLGHRSVRFSHYVGVLQVQDLVIEVLPKTGRITEKELWRDILVDMLKLSGFLNVKAVSEASLNLRGGTLLYLFFEIFLGNCRSIFYEGLVRRYHLNRKNRTALRGRILFSNHLKHNLFRRERFYTESHEYTEDNVYNQILFKALNILSLISTSSAQRKDATLLLQQNDQISDIRCDQETFTRLRYYRTTERYEPAIKLAELIILNYQPDLKAGYRNVLALMFPMEALFEAYVTLMLKQSSRGTPFRISSQKSKHFWRGTDKGFKIIRPDIIIEWHDENEKRKVVLDIKWKIPTDQIPGDSDLKQMFSYNHLFEAEASNLVYPAIYTSSLRPGQFAGHKNGACSMWDIQIFDNESNRLNRTHGKEMLAILSTD